ncbi:homing endonuclease associated repeat-containing protein [Natrinema hispanicum]|uniref:homing endonuclease associated repeat-containing protein n=1 Tax=Natrinema hispanicum TaxID=392421 RepID=UPI0037438E20
MRGGQNKIPREKLITALYELADEVGGSPTREQMIECVRYSERAERASRCEFGRWNKVLLELGYEPPR